MNNKKYDIAAYIWPAYTGDEPRTRIFWEQGIGEWQTVQSPTDKPEWKYNGAEPLWGYVNEADPAVMEKQIDEAAKHGVNVFIYDWYWYDGRPFLEHCLNNGYLKAKNNDKVKFYLMWANHNVNYMWDKRINTITDCNIWHGSVQRSDFDVICDRVIENYFKHPSYYKIDGKPVFLIYDVVNLIKGLGGVEATCEALRAFRKKVTDAGFPGLDLQLCTWSELEVNLSGVDSNHSGSTKDAARLLEFDSMTNYQFAHLTDINRDYLEVFADVHSQWERYDREYDIPYYPHVSIGWDNNLRCHYYKRDITKNSSPENFAKALQAAKDYLDAHPERTPLVTINSWNEWTEGSYLEPDTVNGYGYLEAVKKVFVDGK